ncbi:MAG: hypothetical protein ACOY0S_01630 [Patescibacteria group bacterium]
MAQYYLLDWKKGNLKPLNKPPRLPAEVRQELDQMLTEHPDAYVYIVQQDKHTTQIVATRSPMTAEEIKRNLIKTQLESLEVVLSEVVIAALIAKILAGKCLTCMKISCPIHPSNRH